MVVLFVFSARQIIRWHHVSVINAAYDDRLIGIAFQKIDHYLHANARDKDGAPFFPGPWLRDANPTGTIGVLFALAIPMELNFHSPVLVSEDLFAFGSNDNRRLRSSDCGFDGDLRRNKGQREKECN